MALFYCGVLPEGLLEAELFGLVKAHPGVVALRIRQSPLVSLAS